MVSLVDFAVRFSNRYMTGFECDTGSDVEIDVKAEVGLPVMTRVGAVAETSETSRVVVACCCLAICLISRFDVFISMKEKRVGLPRGHFEAVRLFGWLFGPRNRNV